MMQFAHFFLQLGFSEGQGLCLFLSWTTFLLTYFTRSNSLKHTPNNNNKEKNTVVLRIASFFFSYLSAHRSVTAFEETP